MRALACFTAALVLAASASNARAAPLAYGEAFNALYQIDLGKQQASLIGTNGPPSGPTSTNLKGLTVGPSGTLYAATDNQNSKFLVTVDPTSGNAGTVGSLGLGGQGVGQFDSLDFGMAFTCDGRLWLSSATTGKFWQVDPGSAAVTLVGSTGGPTITGLVANGNVLYGAGARGDNNFYRIDTTTGAATRIGSYGPAVTTWINSISMAFDAQGTLWAVLNYVPPQGSGPIPLWSDLATIDPKTGTLTKIGPITGPQSLQQVGIRGLAIGPATCPAPPDPSAAVAPVDAPWAMILLGLLLVGGTWLRLRFQRA